MSLDTTIRIPNAYHSCQASIVRDQRLSECPKTPWTWEVLPYSLVMPRSFFFSFLLSRFMMLLIPDVVPLHLLVIIPYYMQCVNERFAHGCNAFLKDLPMSHCVFERFAHESI